MVKKQLILEKALELFAKQGFEATSIQQITDHCGISKGAFYLSFKSKDELIIALVDHFMMQFVSDIDRIVRDTEQEQLLYRFYYAIYEAFHKHSDFAKILIKEQSHTLNQEFFQKMQYYDKLVEQSVLFMIERLYGNELETTKYDLIYIIKGFMNMYAQLFLFYNIPLDLEALSKSLVEKTTILARHTTVPFVTSELHQSMQPVNVSVTTEQLLEWMEHKIAELEPSIEKESLILLKQHINEPSLSPAIVNGLLGNIRSHPDCKWIAYLYQRHLSD